MQLGKIIGNVVSTVKEAGYANKTILIVQPIDPKGNPVGKTILAVDTVQAGVGDIVITIDEGNSGQYLIREPQTFTVKFVVAGIVDNVDFSA